MATNRIGWLDGLRAYAIGLVVLVHVSLPVAALSGSVRLLALSGQYGVQLFFVVSAATIYMTLSRSDDVRSWWVRRYFRIAPLYYAAILFYGAWRVAFPDPAGEPGLVKWLAAALANAVFLHGFVPKAINSIVPGGWSIAVEMLFYLFAPFLVRRLRDAGERPWTVGLWSLGLIAGLLGISIIASGRVGNYDFFYYWPFTQAPVFIAALYLIHQERRWLFEGGHRRMPAWLVGAMITGGLAGGLACGVVGGWNHAFAPTLMGIGFTGVLMMARGGWNAAFDNRIAVAIGRVSFSIYVTHFAVIDVLHDFFGFYTTVPVPAPALLVAAFVVVLALSYAVSCACFAWIETPGNRLGRAVALRLADWRAGRCGMVSASAAVSDSRR